MIPQVCIRKIGCGGELWTDGWNGTHIAYRHTLKQSPSVLDPFPGTPMCIKNKECDMRISVCVSV